MNIEQNTSIFRNQLSKIFLLIIFFFITQYTFSQQHSKLTDSTYYYKNAIKGFFLIIFPIPGIYTSFSVGYERYISKHSAIEIGSFYLFNTDEMGLKYHTICIMPAYKYFIISKKKGLNNIWVSGYLSYLFETHTYTENNNKHNFYYYGIGGSIGKKVNLSKDKKWFLDIGFGFAYNIYNDKPIFSNNDWARRLLPRPIIQIGGKF